MKSMSDKELDDVFKSSLEGFEKKPAAGCWKKIEQQLGNKPVKKITFSYWLAAASIIMVIGLSVKLYNSEKQVIRLARADDTPLLVSEVPDAVKEILPVKEESIVIESFDLEKSRKSNEERFLAMVAAFKATDEKNEQLNATKSANNNVFVVNTAKKVAETTEHQKKITEQNLNSERDFVKTTEGVYAEQLVDDAEPSKKEKIKSVGDVVNFLVSKIDKRANKIVHVSKTEESDMEITAINLGLFKYKKEY